MNEFQFHLMRDFYMLPDGLLLMTSPWRHKDHYADVSWHPLRVAQFNATHMQETLQILREWLKDDVPCTDIPHYHTARGEPFSWAMKLAGAKTQKAFAQKAHSFNLYQEPGKQYYFYHGLPGQETPYKESKTIIVGDAGDSREAVCRKVYDYIEALLNDLSAKGESPA